MSAIDASVVIPTYNGGELLDATLKAIFSQRTDKRFEVVVIVIDYRCTVSALKP